MSATGERGKSLHVDIEELAKSDCLGVTQLREVARNVLDRAVALAELDSVGACRLVRDYNFTDTESRRYRYQAVFEITYY